jgi:hypothetical protein
MHIRRCDPNLIDENERPRRFLPSEVAISSIQSSRIFRIKVTLF